MTFSIAARAEGAYGVAVASKFLAVGAVVPAADAGSGAFATQSSANVAYRPQGAGVENLAGRVVPGKIDPLVLDRLRASAGYGEV